MRHVRATTLLATVIMLATAACGRQENVPPVATPSLAIEPAEAPLGAPVEMTYRFQVAPDASIDGAYRVMVHFVDVDDELMWTDDHDPPVPTSEWRPGQTIEYVRTLFLPVYPYLGKATIQVGLYDAASGRRLPLMGTDNGQRAYAVSSIELRPESDGIFLVYGEGWHGSEVSQQNATEQWRWTRQEAKVSFRNPKRDVTVYLHLDGRPDLFGGAQHVSIQIGGAVVDAFTLSSVTRVLHKARIPAAALGDADVVELTLASDEAFRPAELGQTDTRQLGIRVFNLYVQ